MSFLKFLNPLYPLTKVRRDVGASLKGVASTIAASKERYAAQEEAEKEADTDNNKQRLDPAARFSNVVADGSWTEAEIANQSKRFRSARQFFIMAAYIMTPCFVAVGLFTSWWVSLFLIPSAMFFCALMMMLGAKHAWFEWQLESRSFKSFREFASLPNFLSRVLIP